MQLAYHSNEIEFHWTIYPGLLHKLLEGKRVDHSQVLHCSHQLSPQNTLEDKSQDVVHK